MIRFREADPAGCNRERYKWVVRRDHALANNNKVKLESFKDLAFIERPYCTNRKAFERLTNKKTYQSLTKKKLLTTYKSKA
jgi:hypothetical protein